MAANIRPTPSIDSTPSARRAPPDCHRPTAGQPTCCAAAMARAMCPAPTAPSDPPMRVASVQYAMTGDPLIIPLAACTPLSSPTWSMATGPGSSNRPSRTEGLIDSLVDVIVTMLLRIETSGQLLNRLCAAIYRAYDPHNQFGVYWRTSMRALPGGAK